MKRNILAALVLALAVPAVALAADVHKSASGRKHAVVAQASKTESDAKPTPSTDTKNGKSAMMEPKNGKPAAKDAKASGKKAKHKAKTGKAAALNASEPKKPAEPTK